MRATELMIGDYVSVEPSGQRICIAAIHNGKVGYHSVVHRLEWVRIGHLRPIPLTLELFEKNGWEWHDDDAKFFPETWVGNLLLIPQVMGFASWLSQTMMTRTRTTLPSLFVTFTSCNSCYASEV